MDALAKLGIDGWGILLYLVNFGILLVVLQRYVYKPLVKFLDERRDQIKENVEQANTLRTEMEAEREREAAERKEREAKLNDRIADAKRVVKEDAKKLLTEAEAQRDAILSQAGEQADGIVSGALGEAEAETVKRIREVVMHVLKDGVPEDVVKKSVDESWKRVTSQSSYGQ